jgi:hypothetical protein
MLLRSYFTLFYFLLISFCTAQSSPIKAKDISGTWTGNYSKILFSANPTKLVVELYVYNDSMITGSSHLYYANNSYEHYKVSGVFHKKSSTVFFSEDSTIAVKLGFMVGNCLGDYSMRLSASDSSLNLEGTWKDNMRTRSRCSSVRVWLSKSFTKKSPIGPPPFVKDTIKKLPPGIKDTVKKNPPQRVIPERIPDIQSLIEIKNAEKDSIKFEVYDNGEIDNDTVSVLFNNKLLISKQMISLKPITFYVSLSKENPISKVQLLAESLGSIPPCTAVMIITTKTKRYEVNLSSNFYKNGMLELFLKE